MAAAGCAETFETSDAGALMRVGVLGIGRMGSAISRSIAEAGFDVSVYDVRPGASAESGQPVAASATELAATVDALVSVLPGPIEAEDALAAVLPAMASGGLWIDLTSNDPRVADRLGLIATEHGIESVAAPMGGGVDGARSGGLTLYVSGSDSAVARAAPLLTALGTVQLVGNTIGAGHTVKLLANLLWFGQVIAVTEAMLLGTSLGVSPATLRQVLARSAGGSRFIDSHLDALLDGDYLATFGLDRCVEELETLGSLAAESGTPFDLSSLVTATHADALAEFGPIDGELLAAKLLELRAGRTLRR
jgi:3-hydroxyisobutyrate dehydrogenase-like beta-hydroxyacid dehydrogenase